MRRLALGLIFATLSILLIGCDSFKSVAGPSQDDGRGGFWPRSHIKHYGYWFWNYREIANYSGEVMPFTNLIQVRMDANTNIINGINQPTINWSNEAAAAINATPLDIMLQLPLAIEDHLRYSSIRLKFLNEIRMSLASTGSLSRIKYLEISEEWYSVQIPAGLVDEWKIFQGKNQIEKYEIMKKLLEETIADTKKVFPGIPVVIPEPYFDFPVRPPENLDMLAIDAYFNPTSPNCDATQRAKFDLSVKRVYDTARSFGKPIIMIGQAYSGHPAPIMLSQCQTDWFYELAKDRSYNIQVLVWFMYHSVGDVVGVRNYPEIVAHHKKIGCEILRKKGC